MSNNQSSLSHDKKQQKLETLEGIIQQKYLKEKQELVGKYYMARNDKERGMVVRKWPNVIGKDNGKVEGPIKTNNAWYFGNISNQVFHGHGLIIYQKQPPSTSHHKSPKKLSQYPQSSAPNSQYIRYYQGQFQNNCKHGNGLQYINGDVYIGKFINDKPEDNSGVFVWKNGDMYIGGLVNGMKHGKGKWQSGDDYYDGVWKLNKPQGFGKIHTGNSDYQGEVKNGFKHGQGIQIFENGDQYQGNYSNGKPEGEGTYKWKNGAIYRGKFKNGVRYGYGCWIYGNQSYQGEYINDKRNGKGCYKWEANNYYDGEFVDDLRHGYGQMHWSDSTCYKGQWKQGKQHGQGQTFQHGKFLTSGIFQFGKLTKQHSHPKKPRNKFLSTLYNPSKTLTRQRYYTNKSGDKMKYQTMESKYYKCHKWEHREHEAGDGKEGYDRKYQHGSRSVYTKNKKEERYETPVKSISTKYQNNNNKVQLQNINKKNNINTSQSVNINQNKCLWEIQPILWKNFGFVKNYPTNLRTRIAYDHR